MIVMSLSRLAVHYYQPDFTEAMAKVRIQDMVHDLIEFEMVDVERAIEAYRQMPFPPGKFKPFPDSGSLRRLAALERAHRREVEALKPARTVTGDSRPIMWWAQAKQRWQPHWREHEVPEGQLVRDVAGGPLREPKR